jgi:hypothetical protein
LAHKQILPQLENVVNSKTAALPAFPSVPLKIVCGSAEYPGHFRVANLRCEAAALFLKFDRQTRPEPKSS